MFALGGGFFHHGLNFGICRKMARIGKWKNKLFSDMRNINALRGTACDFLGKHWCLAGRSWYFLSQ
jgi:hypothetical protein